MTLIPQTDRLPSGIAARPSESKIAAELGLTRNEFMFMLIEWQTKDPKTGYSVLDKVRSHVYGRVSEEIYNTQMRVVAEFPAIIDNIISIAKGGKSPHSSLMAAQWLWEEIVKPSKSKYEEDELAITDSAITIIDGLSENGEFIHPLSIGDTPLFNEDDQS
jgi:hypothetical protein